MIAKAFAPGNISCVFKIEPHENPRWAGSTGFGFTIDQGVVASVAQSNQSVIVFNNAPIDFPTIKTLMKNLTDIPVTVALQSSLPLGSGFGLSGASALATAYALNQVLKLNKTQQDLAIAAHTAEVINKTGLGDVTNQYFGGFLVKFQPSSKFVVERINMPNCKVYCKYISKLSTTSILTNSELRQRINEAAEEALNQIQIIMQKSMTNLSEILTIAKTFAMQSDLLQNPEVKEQIASIEANGGHASMIMLGNAVMSDIPFAGATEYTISETAAHLV